MASSANIQIFASGEAEHLLALRRLVRGLEQDCRQILTLTQRNGQPHFSSTQLLALVCLAARKIKPASLQAGGELLLSGIQMMLSDLTKFAGREAIESQAGASAADATRFATDCCHFLMPLNEFSAQQCEALLNALQKNLQHTLGKTAGSAAAFLGKIAMEPLTVGWGHEFLAQATTDDLLASGAVEQARRQQTQFFTPAWIADYLCDQTLVDKKSSFTLLDPACGAGHLIVRSIDAVMQETDPQDRSLRLDNVLGHSIYGLDLEPSLLDLAAFSIYLTSRDWLAGQANAPGEPLAKTRAYRAPFVDLPTPNLYTLSAPLGSLSLIAGQSTQLRRGDGPSLSAAEAGLPTAFDGVVMNPPYLSTRTMDDTTAIFLKKYLPESSGDLYTAFIQLAMTLLKDGGRLSTIVQQSFLSISRYRNFRLSLLQKGRLVSVIQLGTGAFPSRPGEKVNNAILTIEKNSARDAFTFLRLEGKEAHLQAEKLGLSHCPTQTISLETATALIDNLSGQPFAFHCPPEIAAIFSEHKALAEIGEDFVLTNGLFTCGNKRFVKLTATLTQDELLDYVPYDKGGGAKWYHQTPHSLFWQDNGQAIRDYRFSRGQSRSLPGEAHYFKAGLTYSYIGTRGFKARLLSPGSIFDIASSAIFSRKYDINYVLGFFNSALVVYLLSILNPTVNFQIGDLRKLPFKAPDGDLERELSKLTAQAISLSRELDERKLSKERQASLIAEEGIIQRQIDELIFDHYQIASTTRATVMDETWVRHSQKLTK